MKKLNSLDLCHGCSILMDYLWSEYREITPRKEINHYTTSDICEVCGAIIETYLSRVKDTP